MIKCSRILSSALQLDIPMPESRDPKFSDEQKAAYGADASTSPAARA